MITNMKRHSNWGRRLWLGILAAGIGIGGYFYLHPQYLPEWAAKTSFGRELQTTTVFKWQDASGRWHVSDQPPAEGIEYKMEAYSRDTNVLPLPPALRP